MADGLVTIAVELQDGSVVKGVADMKKQFAGFDGSTKKSGLGMVAFGAVTGAAMSIASKAFDAVKQSVGGAVSRFDTLNQFPKVMKQMGYSAEDTATATKVLKKGIDGLPTSLSEITKSTQSFAILTGSAEKGAKTALALNDAFLASGASAEDASRGVQQYSQMLASGKVDQDAWMTLAETMPYALDEVAKSFGFTGKAAKNDLYKALQDGTITMDQLNNKFMELDGGASGFAKTARVSSEGIKTSFTNMNNAMVAGLANTLKAIDDGLKNAGLPGIAKMLDNSKDKITKTFETINGVITASIPPIVNTFRSLFDFVNANKGWIKPLIIGVGAFAGTVGAINAVAKAVTVLKVVKSVASDLKLLGFALENMANSSKLARVGLMLYNGAIKAWSAITKAATAVQTAFNVVMDANPITLVVIAIAAIVTALVLWITKTKSGQKAWQGFTNFIKSAWSGMTSFFTGIWNGITNIFKTSVTAVGNFLSSGVGQWLLMIINPIARIVNFITQNWDIIKQTAITVWNSIGTFLSGLWTGIVTVASTIWTGLTTTLSGIWNGIVTVAQAVWNLIKDAVMGPILLLVDALTGNWNQMQIDAQNIWNNITSSVSTIVNVFVNTVKSIITGFSNVITGIWNGIKSISTSVWNGIKSVVTNAANGLSNGVKSVFNGVKSFVSSIWNGVSSISSNVWHSIASLIPNLARSAVNGLRNAWNGITGWVSGIWNGVKSAINNAMHFDLLGAGRAIMNSFLNGLKAAWGAVKDFVGGIGNWIREHKGPISYDRKLLIPAGRAIMGGFNNSLNSNFLTVKKSVTSYAGQLLDAMGDVSFDEVVDDSMKSLADQISDIKPEFGVDFGIQAGLDKAKQLMKNQRYSVASNSNIELSNATKPERPIEVNNHFDNVAINDDRDIKTLAEQLAAEQTIAMRGAWG